MSQDRVTPVPDNERLPLVLPGDRGTESHGVEQHGTPDTDLVDYSLEGDPVVYEPVAQMPPAQPVFIVTDDRVLREFRTSHTYASANPTQVVGRFPARTSCRITNLSAVVGDRVWIAHRFNNASKVSGYPLDPGKELLPFNTEDEVWVLADPASPTVIAGGLIELAVWQDYQIPVR